jgi:hypothetical protein
MLGFKAFRVWFGVILLTFAISGKALSAQEQSSSTPAEYRIAVGDVLQIDVWKQPEITRTTPVRPDGSISLPLINNVKVSGLSALQLAGLIREKLKDLIPNAQVTVTVSPRDTFLAAPPRPHPPIFPPTPPISPDLKQKCCAA